MVFYFPLKCEMVSLVRINLQASLITPYFCSVKDLLYQLRHHILGVSPVPTDEHHQHNLECIHHYH